MAERPIIFSGPMVRAILEGRKTQTRRVIKLPKKTASGGVHYEHPRMGGWAPTTIGGNGTFRIGKDGSRIDVPEMVGIWHQTCGTAIATSHQVGDSLWVRERIRRFYKGTCDQRVQYHADGSWNFDHPGPSPFEDSAGYNVPSIHMPRWASRITLKVTSVKVERLQDISEEDAKAEGSEVHSLPTNGDPSKCFSHRDSYRTIWESIHGHTSWEANPWVAAISFERVK